MSSNASPQYELSHEVQRCPWWLIIFESLLILGIFAVHAGWPVPDDNEAHYLTKAKHYWNEDFGRGDFFLESADAHTAFYWAFGWLSLWLPLPTLAWVGRFLAWGLLAFGWQRLSWSTIPRPWISLLTAALFVLLIERYHMAGEWVVGGIEAKGFSYAFVFLGLAAVARGHWNRSLLWLGCASAFHVVVGGWAAIATAVCWLVTPQDRTRLVRLIPGLVGGSMLALVGLIPALALTSGVDVATVHEANRIYIHERLPHHLVPSTFRPGFVGRHAMLIVAWVLLCTFAPANRPQQRVRLCVAAAIGIAVLGYFIALIGETSHSEDVKHFINSLQRYYWFRLSDAMVPLGVAFGGVSAIYWLWPSRPKIAGAWLSVAVLSAGVYLAARFNEAVLAEIPRGERNLVLADWVDACTWIRENTFEDDVILVPRLASSLTWHTGRPEVANWKNVPQDAPAIVEWWQRMNDVYGNRNPAKIALWVSSLAELGPERLEAVALQYGARYIIVDKDPLLPPLPWTPKFENSAYAIYSIQAE